MLLQMVDSLHLQAYSDAVPLVQMTRKAPMDIVSSLGRIWFLVLYQVMGYCSDKLEYCGIVTAIAKLT